MPDQNEGTWIVTIVQKVTKEVTCKEHLHEVMRDFEQFATDKQFAKVIDEGTPVAVRARRIPDPE